MDKDWSARFGLARDKRIASRLQDLLIPSIIIAGVSAILPVIFKYTGFAYALLLSTCLFGVWAILLIAAIARFKLRGLLLLFGAPLAGFWPYSVVLLFWVCAHDRFSCP